jgi:hypothetical protein
MVSVLRIKRAKRKTYWEAIAVVPCRVRGDSSREDDELSDF